MPESTVTLPSSALTDIELLKNAVSDLRDSQERQHQETKAQLKEISEAIKPIALLGQQLTTQDGAIARCFGEVQQVELALKGHIEHTGRTERKVWVAQGALLGFAAVITVTLGLLTWQALDFIHQTRAGHDANAQDIKALYKQHDADFRTLEDRIRTLELNRRSP